MCLGRILRKNFRCLEIDNVWLLFHGAIGIEANDRRANRTALAVFSRGVISRGSREKSLEKQVTVSTVTRKFHTFARSTVRSENLYICTRTEKIFWLSRKATSHLVFLF